MNRSFKKIPVVKDSSTSMKTVANRIVRRKLKQNIRFKIANGSAYRKMFCSWNISNWLFRETWREYYTRRDRYRHEYENGCYRYGIIHSDFSEGMSYWDWFKMYKRK